MLNIDELSILKIYYDPSKDRDHVLAALKDILPLVEEPDIKRTTESLIRKVTAMTQETFAALDLTDTLLADED